MHIHALAVRSYVLSPCGQLFKPSGPRHGFPERRTPTYYSVYNSEFEDTLKNTQKRRRRMSEDEEEREELFCSSKRTVCCFGEGFQLNLPTSIQVSAILSGNQSGNQTGEPAWSVQS